MHSYAQFSLQHSDMEFGVEGLGFVATVNVQKTFLEPFTIHIGLRVQASVSVVFALTRTKRRKSAGGGGGGGGGGIWGVGFRA